MAASDVFLNALKTRDAKTLASSLTKNPNLALSARAVSEAGRLGWQEGLALLKKHGADLNATYRGYRAMHALIQEDPHAAGSSTPERLACVEWLLANGADPEQLGAWPPARVLLIAAFTGVREYVDVILRSGRAKQDLFTHVALGKLKEFRKELAMRDDAAQRRDQGVLTALQCAAGSRMGHGDARTKKALYTITEELLGHGADPNVLTRSWGNEVDAAYFAASAGNLDIFRLLLDAGADPNRALPSTLWRSDMVFAEIALARGAEPDKSIQDGRPVLNELIRWGRVDSALWLLDHHASPNIPDARGWTAMHQAVSRGNDRLVRALLEKGADLSAKDANGATPYDLAQAMRRAKVVEALRPQPPHKGKGGLKGRPPS